MKIFNRADTSVNKAAEFRSAIDQEAERLDAGLASALRHVAADDWTEEQVSTFTRIELAREHIYRSGMHLGEPYGADTTVGQMARRASKSGHQAQLLYALVAYQQPTRALEMGTCCGITAAYQAAALPDGASLTTLELSPTLVGAARTVLGLAGVGDRVDVVPGDFADTLDETIADEPQYAFVDGNHSYAATVDYFDRLAKACPSGALLVFDDIDWSDGMRQAWTEIRDDSRVSTRATLPNTGVAILA